MRALLLLVLLAAPFARASAADACCAPPAEAAPAASTTAPGGAGITVGGCYGKPDPQPAPAPVGHPLKGVILDILADRSSLLVKHEEIPGVMKAMTMLLKVDAPTLAAAKKGQAITATLVKKPDGWWLEAVTPAPAP